MKEVTKMTNEKAKISIKASATKGRSAEQARTSAASNSMAMKLLNVEAMYGTFRAVNNVTLDIEAKSVTAFIGPSGCGKTTLLRTLNRMHETLPGATVKGSIQVGGADLYDPSVDPVRVRRSVGMVFQKPNPFPAMSIAENVSSGLRLSGTKSKSDVADIVEDSLRKAALWDEVKDKLKEPGVSLSGGQQQRLCIARTIAVEPEIVLMDEPCSALDPLATLKIEELIGELKTRFTIVIVTHNMQQAARVSDTTAFFNMGADRGGYLVETGPTNKIFTNPSNKLTEDYIAGRFG
jgi:phosphate transport system ATP-binding protein